MPEPAGLAEKFLGIPYEALDERAKNVFCALEVLIEREQTRGDRKIGLAESQFH
ncbi:MULTISPECIES: chloramphenicol phosphotransferase CPT family protein [Burkholderia cepacia complex]|uniref:chloramphenicol phosphotransferase CPT family protein n=1 Tax=Burkholderia cepacia complex TaxID=87882 RepID=UPI001FC8AC8F|nr:MULTISPECIES: chloramphenicol phosphotransferase CPT family protein [Burkholderia cepacia complex]